MDPTAANVLTVICGHDSLCCNDSETLKQIRSKAVQRLKCEIDQASSLVQVADQQWDFDKFVGAVTRVIEWCDRRIDELDHSGYLVSNGPGCPS